jgi:3-oxo-5-alpha-steroid 4-dehydrogenase 1
MMEKGTFDLIVLSWILTGCMVFPILLKVTAPYGRHATRNWGITIPNKAGWILMELPALLIFIYFVTQGKADKNAAILIIAALFTFHYINRSLIYPFRIRTEGKRMPLLIAILAVIFNTANSCINGYYLGTLQIQYTSCWLSDPRFIIGILIFIAGMFMNIMADEKLIHMRKNRTNGYKVPYGQLFNIISCPNFFGEIVEWMGFAILCWSLPAFSFFIWTLCNLVPRALDHHRWYKKQFPDYPANRKAVLPFLL